MKITELSDLAGIPGFLFSKVGFSDNAPLNTKKAIYIMIEKRVIANKFLIKRKTTGKKFIPTGAPAACAARPTRQK